MMKRTGMLLLMAILAASAGGCSIFKWMVAVAAPPEKVKPQYVPPKDKTVLVFVDDVRHPVDYPLIKNELTAYINQQLLAHHLAAQVIDYDRLQDLTTSTPKFHELTVHQVGQKLGADWILYVEIEKFSLKDNNMAAFWKGRLETSVRVVDAQGKRLWPTDRTGGYMPPPVETPSVENTSVVYGTELSRTMAGMMADRIVKLFYEYEGSAEEASQ